VWEVHHVAAGHQAATGVEEDRRAFQARVAEYESRARSLASFSTGSARAGRPCYESIPSLVFVERLGFQPAPMTCFDCRTRLAEIP
jgi:hypothetical protein